MDDFPVRIYAVNVKQLEEERLFEAAYECVTEERRKKTDRIRSLKDKQLSLGAELLLRYGLSQLKAGTPRYRFGENGKPYLDNAEGLYFNLSHSGEMAVCALAPCETGCDVEKIRDRGLAVARRFFVPAEYERIAALKEELARREMFCRFWTLKESFLKVTGQGMKLGLDSFQIILGEESISVIQNVDQRINYFREYEIGEGYCCAACAVRDSFEPRVRRVNIRDLLP